MALPPGWLPVLAAAVSPIATAGSQCMQSAHWLTTPRRESQISKQGLQALLLHSQPSTRHNPRPNHATNHPSAPPVPLPHLAPKPHPRHPLHELHHLHQRPELQLLHLACLPLSLRTLDVQARELELVPVDPVLPPLDEALASGMCDSGTYPGSGPGLEQLPRLVRIMITTGFTYRSQGSKKA